MIRQLLPLLLLGCQLPNPSQQLPPPPGTYGLAVGPLFAGEPLELTATGVPTGQQVTFLYGNGPGPGACPAVLGGGCIGVANHLLLGTAVANADGIATFAATVPPTVPAGATAWFQAGWIAGGVGTFTPARSRVTGLDDPDLLLTEVVVTPTAGEMIEIYNPGSTTADLSNVWLADYDRLQELPIGGGAPASSDLRVRFPDGATLAPGAFAVVSLSSATDFENTWGMLPDYDLDITDVGAPAMVGEFGGSSGLSNRDEMVMLFRWDGANDFVVDLDYLVYGNTSDAIDRTGLSYGVHTYLPDTPVALQSVATSPASGVLARCELVDGIQGLGGNGFANSDETSEDLAVSWMERPGPTPGEASDCLTLPLSFVEVDFDLPWFFEGAPGTVLLDSQVAFEAFFGTLPPASLDLGTHLAVFHTMGPSLFPGSTVAITGLTLSGGDLEVALTEQEPGNTCGLLDHTPEAWSLVATPIPTDPVVSVSADLTASAFDCAADGRPNGDTCYQDDLCGTGLICHGLATGNGAGNCRDDIYNVRLTSTSPLAIPDNDPIGVSETLVVTGQASVPEDTIVTLDITHPDPSQLTIVLLNPLGTPTTIWNAEPAPGPNLQLTRAVFTPSDEDINGDWTLVVSDNLAGSTGTVDGWSMLHTSRFD